MFKIETDWLYQVLDRSAAIFKIVQQPRPLWPIIQPLAILNHLPMFFYMPFSRWPHQTRGLAYFCQIHNDGRLCSENMVLNCNVAPVPSLWQVWIYKNIGLGEITACFFFFFPCLGNIPVFFSSLCLGQHHMHHCETPQSLYCCHCMHHQRILQ